MSIVVKALGSPGVSCDESVGKPGCQLWSKRWEARMSIVVKALGSPGVSCGQSVGTPGCQL